MREKLKVELTALTTRVAGNNPDMEFHCEMAARDCYDSGDKAKDSASNLVKTCTISDHLTINGHAMVSFRVTGLSRAASHQLVRQRTACFSQRSQRYVKEGQFGYVIPKSAHTVEDETEFVQDMAKIQQMYDKYLKKGWKKEDARFVLPNACSTVINMSTSLEGWMHFLRRRMDKHAQWEIRALAFEIYRQLNQRCGRIINKETIMAPRKLSIDWDSV